MSIRSPDERQTSFEAPALPPKRFHYLNDAGISCNIRDIDLFCFSDADYEDAEQFLGEASTKLKSMAVCRQSIQQVRDGIKGSQNFRTAKRGTSRKHTIRMISTHGLEHFATSVPLRYKDVNEDMDHLDKLITMAFRSCPFNVCVNLSIWISPANLRKLAAHGNLPHFIQWCQSDSIGLQHVDLPEDVKAKGFSIFEETPVWLVFYTEWAEYKSSRGGSSPLGSNCATLPNTKSPKQSIFEDDSVTRTGAPEEPRTKRGRADSMSFEGKCRNSKRRRTMSHDSTGHWTGKTTNIPSSSVSEQLSTAEQLPALSLTPSQTPSLYVTSMPTPSSIGPADGTPFESMTWDLQGIPACSAELPKESATASSICYSSPGLFHPSLARDTTQQQIQQLHQQSQHFWDVSMPVMTPYFMASMLPSPSEMTTSPSGGDAMLPDQLPIKSTGPMMQSPSLGPPKALDPDQHPGNLSEGAEFAQAAW